MVRDTPPADDYSWRGQVGRLVNGMPIEVDPRDIVGCISCVISARLSKIPKPGYVSSAFLFTLTPRGPRRYEPVGDLAVNVVAVRRLITLPDGLSETMAASTLLELARDR